MKKTQTLKSEIKQNNKMISILQKDLKEEFVETAKRALAIKIGNLHFRNAEIEEEIIEIGKEESKDNGTVLSIKEKVFPSKKLKIQVMTTQRNKLSDSTKNDFINWCIEKNHGLYIDEIISKQGSIFITPVFCVKSEENSYCRFENLPNIFKNTLIIAFMDDFGTVIIPVQITNHVWKMKTKGIFWEKMMNNEFFTSREEVIKKGIYEFNKHYNEKQIKNTSLSRKWWNKNWSRIIKFI